MPPLCLSKGKILRAKSKAGAEQIFAALPEGCARREGNEVVIMRPVLMSFEVAPEPATPASKKAPHPFIFDFRPGQR